MHSMRQRWREAGSEGGESVKDDEGGEGGEGGEGVKDDEGCMVVRVVKLVRVVSGEGYSANLPDDVVDC